MISTQVALNPKASSSALGLRPLSLNDVLEVLATAGEKILDVQIEDDMVGAGYHITEVKAGSFVALDCGGNPDRWSETILQIEDVQANAESQMTAGKFTRILGKVSRDIEPDMNARLTVEVGPPDSAMRVFDAVHVSVDAERAVLSLGPRPAICKPRHRDEANPNKHQSSACCSPSVGAQKCCG